MNSFPRLKEVLLMAINRVGMLVIVASFLAVGCSSSEDLPPRYSAEGTVKLDGEPLKQGTLNFNPDVDAGTDGPSAFAIVKDGKFTIAESQGLVEGQVVAYLTVYDSEQQVEEDEDPDVIGMAKKTIIIKPENPNKIDLEFTKKQLSEDPDTDEGSDE